MLRRMFETKDAHKKIMADMMHLFGLNDLLNELARPNDVQLNDFIIRIKSHHILTMALDFIKQTNRFVIKTIFLTHHHICNMYI